MSEQRAPVTEEELHAYVDGTLSDERRQDVERALEHNPDLAARVSDYFSLNNLLHDRYDRVLGEPVPSRLQPLPSARRRPGAANWPRFAGFAAALVLGIGIGWGAQYGRDVFAGSAGNADFRAVSADGADVLARQAAFAHVVYMPTVTRPAELGDAQEQDFVRWLSSRLGTDLHPPMLARDGFELVGGRLLPGDDGEIAQFMYRNAAGERVTLCISRRKVSANTTAFRLYRDGSVSVFYWVDGDFGYALSGGIDRQVLLQLSHDVYAQITSGRTG